MTNIIGVKNPYGLVQKAGKRKTHKKRKSCRRKFRRTHRNYK
jgi:uncharacterized protein (DUF362 family)